MLTFLIRSATSQSSSYPIVLTRLGEPRFRPNNPHLKFVEVPGIEPATSCLIVRPVDDSANEAVVRILFILIFFIMKGNL